MDGGAALAGFWKNAVAIPDQGHAAITYDWYRTFLQTLLDTGLTLPEAWDVAEIAAMYKLTNRMAMATNMLPNPEYSGQARP